MSHPPSSATCLGCGEAHTPLVACLSCGTPRTTLSSEIGICMSCVARSLTLMHAAPAAATPVPVAPAPAPTACLAAGHAADSSRVRREYFWLRVATATSLTVTLLVAAAVGVAWLQFLGHAPVRLGPRAFQSSALARPYAAPSSRAVPAAFAPHAAPAPYAATPPVAPTFAPPAPLPPPAFFSQPSAAAVPPVPWPAALLENAGTPTHDPYELLARAQRLARDGLDLTIVQSRVSRATALRARDGFLEDMASMRWSIAYHDGRPYGLRFERLGRAPSLQLLGLADGDVLLTVDGYSVPANDGHDGLEAWRRPSREVPLHVAEVLRGGHRLVLAVAWPAGTTPALPTASPAPAPAPQLAGPRAPYAPRPRPSVRPPVPPAPLARTSLRSHAR